VDDHADSRDLFAAILRRRGAEVTAVDTVREGLARPRGCGRTSSCVTSRCPATTAFTLIREIRSWPSDQGIVVPAVALTAYARPEDRERALAAGFQVHLSKPVEPRALLEAVARLAAGGARDG
jgi:CheY-like chemotaxis protein